MIFDLSNQRHQFGVLLVLFILVYSSTANEPRKAIQVIEESQIYDQNCNFGEEITLNDDVREYCEMMDNEIEEYTISYSFRCGIMAFAGVIAIMSFLDKSEDGG